MDFRFDFLGLSTEDMPTTNLVNGTTFYEVDTMKLYIYYKGDWYLQEKQEEDSSDDDNGGVG